MTLFIDLSYFTEVATVVVHFYFYSIDYLISIILRFPNFKEKIFGQLEYCLYYIAFFF